MNKIATIAEGRHEVRTFSKVPCIVTVYSLYYIRIQF